MNPEDSSNSQEPKKQKGMSLTHGTPCAACKYLRRKCQQGCPFAPYFPADNPSKFAKVHKVYGASNVSKLLSDMEVEQRADAVNSLVYEAEYRLRDPIYGCVGLITQLNAYLYQIKKDLVVGRNELTKYIGTRALYPIGVEQHPVVAQQLSAQQVQQMLAMQTQGRPEGGSAANPMTTGDYYLVRSQHQPQQQQHQQQLQQQYQQYVEAQNRQQRYHEAQQLHAAREQQGRLNQMNAYSDSMQDYMGVGSPEESYYDQMVQAHLEQQQNGKEHQHSQHHWSQQLQLQPQLMLTQQQHGGQKHQEHQYLAHHWAQELQLEPHSMLNQQQQKGEEHQHSQYYHQQQDAQVYQHAQYQQLLQDDAAHQHSQHHWGQQELQLLPQSMIYQHQQEQNHHIQQPQPQPLQAIPSTELEQQHSTPSTGQQHSTPSTGQQHSTPSTGQQHSTSSTGQQHRTPSTGQQQRDKSEDRFSTGGSARSGGPSC